jgi:hypothetical protein
LPGGSIVDPVSAWLIVFYQLDKWTVLGLGGKIPHFAAVAGFSGGHLGFGSKMSHASGYDSRPSMVDAFVSRARS